MEVPDLVRRSLGDEDIQAGVSLGDEDAICFTPTRSLVYRGEGLLSDEGVSEYPHDFERLAVSEGRRKTKYTLTYVDGKAEFAVPGSRTEPVLERLLESALRVDGVLEGDESVAGVFRFSELTLVVAQQRVLKHVGEYTWDGDFEVYPFDDVTGLHFEEGSVATSVVIEAGGRTQRIKAPNDQAGIVRQTLEEALFGYYDVGSLDALNREIAVEEDGDADDGTDDPSGGLGLESGIDPLVSDDGGAEAESSESVGVERESSTGEPGRNEASTYDLEGSAASATDTTGSASGDDLESITDQLADLTATVERQNELLERQRQTVEQLIEELRRGR